MGLPPSPRRSVAPLLILTLAALAMPCPGREPGLPAGTCGPESSVRPGQFGYHQTRWRQWPGAAPASATPRDFGPPVSPPRAIVPDADEESPRRAPAIEPSSTDPPPVAERLGRLVEEAEICRLADVTRREEFTRRLVAAMLTEADPRDRCLVLGLAADFDTPAAEAICAGALDDPDPQVRLAACQVCAGRRGPERVPRLARRARADADLGVRLHAVRVLGEVGDAAAIPHLVAILEDPDPVLQSRAAAALARATGQDLGADVERWRQWAAAPRTLPPPRWSLGGSLRRLF